MADNGANSMELPPDR